MIIIVVVNNVLEKLIVGLILAGKLGMKWEDWRFFKNVGKTALVSMFAGVITLFAFREVKDVSFDLGASVTRVIFTSPSQNVIDFVSGSLTLGVTFLIFVSIYIFGLHYLNLIDQNERELVSKIFRKLQNFFRKEQMQNP
ncbi:MAG: hypothetical protein WKF71_05690 [Pyrinomonadaceae bacterium]